MGRLNESRISALLTDAVAVGASTQLETTVHAKHGASVAIGLDGEVTAVGERVVKGRVVIVPPDVPHALTAPGPVVQLIYDPELVSGLAAFSRERGEPFALDGREGERVRAAVVSHRATITRAETLRGIAGELSGWLGQRSRPLDRRVARVVEQLRYPGDGRPVAALSLGVSEAHLRELFARDVGIPVRTFQLWRRLLMGLSHYGPHDTTKAASLAGFADLAHFTRTCRRMLGNPPTIIRERLLPR